MYIHYKGRLNEEDERRERPCYTHYTQISLRVHYVCFFKVALSFPIEKYFFLEISKHML